MKPADYRELIDALGGPAKVAKMFGLHVEAVGQFRRRNRFPPKLWEEMIQICDEMGIEGIDPQWFFDRIRIARRDGVMRRQPGEGTGVVK